MYNFNYKTRLLSLLIGTLFCTTLVAQQRVTSPADSGPGSLRNAIMTATAGQTIELDGNLSGQTISLLSPVDINQNLTIRGLGTDAQLTGAAGVFTVTSGTLSLFNVSISSATAIAGAGVLNRGGSVEVFNSFFSNNDATGPAASDGGGAITSRGGTVYVENTSFTGNSASGTNGSGGAILTVDGATLRVIRSTFTGNIANRAGGAIEDASSASTDLYAVTFTNNQTGSAPGNGGAVHVTGSSTVTIEASTATGNTADAEGGAFWNGTGTMNIGNTLISGNTASGNDANQGGGGIYNLSGILVLTGSTQVMNNVANGTAGSGGGILNDVGGTLEVYGSEISGNSAMRAGGGIEDVSGAATLMRLANIRLLNNTTGSSPGNGGGLHITGDGGVEFHGGQVSGNVAANEGGGLWNGAGRMLVLGTLITNNTASGNLPVNGGGGIFNKGGELEVQSNANISGNIADGASGSGGGIFNADGGRMKVVRSVIADNTASRAGGGIEDASGDATEIELYEVTLRNNSTASAPGNGGALHISGNGGARLFNLTVLENTASAEGGGLWNGTGLMYIDNCSITNNVASGNDADQGGGGVYNNGGQVVIVANTTISDNVADGTSGSGGGIFNAAGGSLAIYSANVTRNTANRAGGGIEDASGAATTVEIYKLNLVDNVVNTSPGNGGGLHISGDGNLVIKDSNVNRNTAGSEGGGLWNSLGTMTINNVSVEDNVALGDAADNGGGGLFNNGGMMVLEANVRVKNNVATGTSGSGGGIFNATGGTLTVNGSEISYNVSNRAGGGIEDASNASIAVSNSTIAFNSTGASPGNGGGIHITGTASVDLTNSLFEENVASAEGGGFWNGRGIATISNTRFIRNTASGNDANQGGGAIYSLSGTVNIMDSQISDNVANGLSGSGGGMLLDSTAAASISQVTFIRNTANRAGGAIEDNSRAGTLVEVTDCILNENSCGPRPGNGGAIHITGNGNMNVTGGEVNRNVAAAEGGGLWNGSGTMNVTLVTVNNNTAQGDDPTQGGGGIFNNGGTLNISRSTVAYNQSEGATGLGGGINNDGGTVTIEVSTISNNQSASNAGGIVNAGTMTINSSTIAQNQSANFGGGIGQAAGAESVTISNSIVALNSAPNRGSNLDVAAGSYISAGFNLIESDDVNVFTAISTDIVGTVTNPIDARLGSLSNNGGPTMTHAINCGSAAINVGDPSITMADQRGIAVQGTRDIGAFENQDNCRPAPVQALDPVASFDVFPNVTRGTEVTVRSTSQEIEEVRYQLLDANGQLIREIRGNQASVQMSLAGLIPGSYFVRKVSNTGVETQCVTLAE